MLLEEAASDFFPQLETELFWSQLETEMHNRSLKIRVQTLNWSLMETNYEFRSQIQRRNLNLGLQQLRPNVPLVSSGDQVFHLVSKFEARNCIYSCG